MSDSDENEPVDITVTDMRASTFNQVKKSQRVQHNVYLEGVMICQSNPIKSFKKLLTRIKEEVQLSNDFVVCNSSRELISPGNITLLRNGDAILVFDHIRQPFPITYEQKINATPHSHAVTHQDGVYYGLPEHNRAAFALAELVDNSLAATANNEGKRIIDIRFYENGTQSSLHVLDNGCGMNFETLKAGLTFKAPKESRRANARNFANTEATELKNDPADEVHPIYINSNISKFGAGMKQCAFWIGEYLRVMTKRKDTVTVHDVVFSKNELERMEASDGKEKPWELTQKCRNPGEPPEVSPDSKPVPKIVQDLIRQEVGKPSFTHIILAELKDGDGLECIRRTEKNGTSLERQLAHVYHYYIHGRDGFSPQSTGVAKPQQAAGVDIIVSRFVTKDGQAILVRSLNLRDITPFSDMESLESKFIRTAEDTFRFTIEVSQFNRTTKPFKVGGMIRYHAYHFDGETHPEGLLTRKGHEGTLIIDEVENDDKEVCAGAVEETEPDSDEASGEGQSHCKVTSSAQTSVSSLTTRKCKDFFHIWWNGRLIPITRLESFDWCSPSSKIHPSNPLYKCYDRISGSLFFDSNVEGITDNKLNLSTKEQLMHMFNEKRIGGQQATFQRITVGVDAGKNKSPVLKTKRMKVKKEFDDWIKDCHKKYDKQVRYYGYLGITKEKYGKSTKDYYKFRKADWHITLEAGDAVRCIRRKPHVIGKIKWFLVEAGNVIVEPNKSTGAPLSLVQIEQVPEVLYGDDVVVTKSMTEIDITATVESVQTIMDEMEKELQMKLEFHDWYGNELKEGAEIPMDAVLIKNLHVKVKRTIDQKEILGTLFHPAANKAKKIYLIARVYRILTDGTREVYWTTSICLWNTAYKGYFFKSIDLRQIMITEPGDYGITFLSYIDVHEHHLRLKGKGQGDAPRRRSAIVTASAAVRHKNMPDDEAIDSDTIENAAEIESDNVEGVDDIGRHSLRSGNNIIPMPIHPGINFKVVAGTPHKFSIENIGEDCVEFQIGEPFDVTLKFEDAKGNPTKPESCEGLIPMETDKPLVFIVPGSKNVRTGNIKLDFNYKDLIAVGNRVIIRGVVAKGVLAANFVDCRVAVRLQWKNKKTEVCNPYMVRFSNGAPIEITVLETNLEIENGTYPTLTCLVTDVCGNIVSRRTSDNKPLMLVCDIYKGKSVKPTKLFDSIKIMASDSRREPQKMLSRIDLEELKNGQKEKVRFVCRISFDNCKGVAIVPMKLLPSKRPGKLRVYLEPAARECIERSGQKKKELHRKSEHRLKVGQQLDCLTFKIFDGLGNEVVPDHSNYKLKFDWPKAVPRDSHTQRMFEAGVLPCMQIPTVARIRRVCSTTLTSRTPSLDRSESTLEVVHRFYLTTLPVDPFELKVNVNGHLAGERVHVKLDELSNIEIVASVQDKYGNVITEFNDDGWHEMEMGTPDFFMKFVTICCAEDTEHSRINGSFVLRRLGFIKSTPPVGDRDFVVKFGPILKATLLLKLIPGNPVSLAFEIDGTVQVQAERNETSRAFSLPNQTNARVRVHLKDAYGNTVPMGGINIVFSVARKMIGYETKENQFTNSGGIANFKLVRIGVKLGEVPSSCRVQDGMPCPTKCYNLHHVNAKCGDFGGITAHCSFHILCRQEIPSKLSINCNQFVCTVGHHFDEFTATLEAEDDSTVTGAKLEDLSLAMTSDGAHGSSVHDFQLNPINVHEGIYSFGTAPEVAGRYRLEFTFNDGKVNFNQKLDKLFRVCSSLVNSLEPENQITNTGIVCVSNDPDDKNKRAVVTNLILVLKDKYKNTVTEYLTVTEIENMGDLLNGKVKIQLNGKDSNRILFENPDLLITKFPLNDGIVIIPDIVLRKETDVPNNSKYVLNFTAQLQNREVYTYLLEFTFYNDISQQEERQGLENTKISLEICMKNLKSECGVYNQGLQKFQNEHAKVKVNEDEIKARLFQAGVDLNTKSNIAKRECDLVSHQRILDRQRRGTESNVEYWEHINEQDVLGVIGHLAQIKSEGEGNRSDLQLQGILSWHLQKYLSVVVTLTSHKGRELERRFERKEFMLLDLIQVESISWKEEIPIKLRNFGNPKYARSLLQLTATDSRKIEHTQKVFNSILGRTVLVNTLEDATNYRHAYNNGGYRGYCPIILTRDGHRIGRDAIIGGDKNRAKPLEHLTYKFGLAPSTELINIDIELKALSVLTKALEARLDAEDNLEKYIKKNKEKMEKIREELDDYKVQKQEIEIKLYRMNEERQSQIWNLQNQSQSTYDPDMIVSSTSSVGLTSLKFNQLEKVDSEEDVLIPYKRSRH